MNCKTKKCCCCIPVKIGTYLIGGIHVIYLFLFLYKHAVVDAVLNLFTGMTFITMLLKDSQFTRMVFFAAFVTYVCIFNSLDIYFTLFPWEDEKQMIDEVITNDC